METVKKTRKTKEQEVSLVDRIPEPIVEQIFRHASANYKNPIFLCAILRQVCKSFRNMFQDLWYEVDLRNFEFQSAFLKILKNPLCRQYTKKIRLTELQYKYSVHLLPNLKSLEIILLYGEPAAHYQLEITNDIKQFKFKVKDPSYYVHSTTRNVYLASLYIDELAPNIVETIYMFRKSFYPFTNNATVPFDQFGKCKNLTELWIEPSDSWHRQLTVDEIISIKHLPLRKLSFGSMTCGSEALRLIEEMESIHKLEITPGESIQITSPNLISLSLLNDKFDMNISCPKLKKLKLTHKSSVNMKLTLDVPSLEYLVVDSCSGYHPAIWELQHIRKLKFCGVYIKDGDRNLSECFPNVRDLNYMEMTIESLDWIAFSSITNFTGSFRSSLESCQIILPNLKRLDIPLVSSDITISCNELEELSLLQNSQLKRLQLDAPKLIELRLDGSILDNKSLQKILDATTDLEIFHLTDGVSVNTFKIKSKKLRVLRIERCLHLFGFNLSTDQLRYVYLINTFSVDDSSLLSLKKSTNLRTLILRENKVTDKSIALINQNFAQLQHLEISRSLIKNVNISLPFLFDLYLSDNRAMKSLSIETKSITSLNLDGCNSLSKVNFDLPNLENIILSKDIPLPSITIKSDFITQVEVTNKTN